MPISFSLPALRLRHAMLTLPLIGAVACGAPPVVEAPPAQAPTRAAVAPEILSMYREFQDGDLVVPAISARHLVDPRNHRQEVDYWTSEAPGAIVVDPYQHFLYYVLPNDRAIRYRIGVGEEGRKFQGGATIPRKAEWPRWTPTANMLREDPELYEPHRNGMEGGLENPLGARALYLYRNGRDTLYRIHGTYAPWSIGQSVSAGCIRLFNHDIIDLYNRVETGTRVVVLSESESGRGTVPPATIADAADGRPQA
jgi:lipoprotein-anchoring transpeptidase ErfK/SrfK